MLAVVLILCVLKVHVDGERHYPLTDPNNLEGWVVYEPFTDEFNSNSLNMTKWYNYNPWWKGRQPALFEKSNVRMSNGTLQLWAEYDNPKYSPTDGYHDWSTSAVVSKTTIKYGYVEIKAKVGTSKISSAFWFTSNINGDRTEIDVFEESGPIDQQKEFYGEYHENYHIFSLNGVSNSELPKKCNCTQNSGNSDCSNPYIYTPSYHDFSSDFHVFGMNWTESRLITYLDGQQRRNIENFCFKYPLYLEFDRETMPDWFGMPNPSTMPDTPFTIQYVRAWTQQ